MTTRSERPGSVPKGQVCGKGLPWSYLQGDGSLISTAPRPVSEGLSPEHLFQGGHGPQVYRLSRPRTEHSDSQGPDEKSMTILCDTAKRWWCVVRNAWPGKSEDAGSDPDAASAHS